MEHLAILLLGSNLGNRQQHLETAERYLQSIVGKIEKKSAIYASRAWGKTDQPDFLNRVISFNTDSTPMDLLDKLLAIESKFGRVRTEKWGPRVLDLDILYYDDLVYSDNRLTIPHPGISGRRFTLVPLCEIYPEKLHPVYQLNNMTLLDKCTDQGEVIKIEE